MKYYFLIILLIVAFALRVIYFMQQQQGYPDGETITFHARLMQEPEQKGRFQSFSLRPDGYEPIYISSPLFPEYNYADILEVTGRVKLSEGEKKTFPTMSYPTITVQENDSLFYGLIASIRSRVRTIYEGSLPPVPASLLMGIVFGIKTGMPDAFKTALQDQGVYHVVAASGMNVTLVAGAFLTIFGFFLRRQWALILSIGGIFFYAFLSGFEPSIIRASLMGSIIFISAILGRQNTGIITLGFTGYAMLFWQPTLITDVGFQLSFLATLGILVIKPALNLIQIGEARLGRPALYLPQTSGKKRNDNMVTEDLKTTLAAILATLPILLSAFGQVSFLSIIVNMLILWTIPPLMIIGAVSAIVGFVLEPLAHIMVFLALPLLWYFEWIVMLFSRFDWSLTIAELPLAISLGYYILLFTLVFWRKRWGD